jgi:hypothetical protein
MMNERHQAYNVATGEIITAPRAKMVKEATKLASHLDGKYYGCKSEWRFCHDGGKRWREHGVPRV